MRIWAKIAHNHKDWKLVTFGNGDLTSLQLLAIKLGIEEQTELNPPTQNVEKEMINSSIFTLSSKYEGFGLVLTEAMACGLPVISFGCMCGPKDIISDDEDGFLIQEKDLDTFAKKLSLLIEDTKLREKMGKSASTNVMRYNEDTVMNKWINLFDELINQPQ